MNRIQYPIPVIKLAACQDFFDPANAPLDLAAAVTNTASLLSRNVWRKRLAAVGENAFRYELYLFWCDLRAGEGVRSRAKAFTAQLNRSIAAKGGLLGVCGFG